MSELQERPDQEICSPLGLIAGNGFLPVEFARRAIQKGIKVIAVLHTQESDPELEQLASEFIWVRVGELGKTIKFLKRHSCSQVAFAGGIKRLRWIGGVRPDLRALKLLAGLKNLRDDALLRAVSSELEKSGLKVIAPNALLPDYIPNAGILTKRSLSLEQQQDALIGWQVAKLLGEADVGQTVVVAQGTVIALEAIEGTDETIRRAGAFKANTPLVVKVSKPKQDLRLDLPTIGVHTIEVMHSAGISAIVIEANKTLLLDPVAIITLANKYQIAIEAR